MLKKTLGGLLALSLLAAPVAAFAAPGHGAQMKFMNVIKHEQQRVNKQLNQVVKKEDEIAKQKAKLSAELTKKQLKVNPAFNQVRLQIAKLVVKQAHDRKALLAAVEGNKFDAAQTALTNLKADYDQITALRTQLKNGTNPAPVQDVPTPTSPTTTGDTIEVQPTTQN